jgi:hypothetical protein
MGVQIQLFEVGTYRSDFCLWGWMKSEVYKEKVNTRDDLVACIMNSAALIKRQRQDDLRRATRTVAKRVEKCTEVNCGIFEHLLWTVAIYWDHLHNQYMQSISQLSSLHTFHHIMLDRYTLPPRSWHQRTRHSVARTSDVTFPSFPTCLACGFQRWCVAREATRPPPFTSPPVPCLHVAVRLRGLFSL